MTPEYALYQLLKLGALSFDDIVKYTGWTDDKAEKTVKSLKQSGAIVWEHKPSRYAVRVLYGTLDSADVQRLPIAVLNLRRGRHQKPSAYATGARRKKTPFDSMVSRLCKVRPQRSGTQTAGEGIIKNNSSLGNKYAGYSHIYLQKS